MLAETVADWETKYSPTVAKYRCPVPSPKRCLAAFEKPSFRQPEYGDSADLGPPHR